MSTPEPREIEAFRDRADRFVADLDEEYYLHFAGLKETLDVEQVYERYEELTRLETAQEMEGAPVELWRFACEGFLGNLTREHQARMAQVEAELEATVDGETHPLPDAARRDVERGRPRRARAARADAASAARRAPEPGLPRRGAKSTARPCARSAPRTTTSCTSGSASASTSSATSARALLDDTEKLWEREGDSLFRARLGIGLSDARPWDVARLFRAPELDQLYPSDRMLPALEATLTDLGIDLRSQENVHLDLESRPSKTPRAFCAPIEVPGKVMLVIQPIGGKDDWEALFHEAGHTEHYAHTSADPCRWRRSGSATWR